MTFTWTEDYQNLIENPILLVIFALTCYRLTRFLVEDVFFEPLREFVWKKFPPSTKFGYLFTCYWCMSVWTAAGWLIVWGIVPEAALVLSLLMSISAVIGLISAWTER
jgi:hypothetical protein